MKTRAYISLSLLLSLGLCLCACSRKEPPSPPQPPEPGKEEPKKPDNPVPKPPSKQQVHTLTIEGYSQPPSRGSLSATFPPDGLLLSYTIEVRDSNGRPKPDKSSSKVYNHVGDIIQWSGRAYTDFGSCDVVSYDYDYSLSTKGHVIRETEADIVRGAHHTNIYTWRGSQIQRIDHILTNEQRARQWIIYEYSGKDVITKLYEETSPRPVWTRRSRYDEEHRLLSRITDHTPPPKHSPYEQVGAPHAEEQYGYDETILSLIDPIYSKTLFRHDMIGHYEELEVRYTNKAFDPHGNPTLRTCTRTDLRNKVKQEWDQVITYTYYD